MPGQSPSQTVGPFFHIELTKKSHNVLVQPNTLGKQIIIQGQVLDGDGKPIDDAMIEIWHADANGYYDHPNDPNQAKADPHFRGFGRADTINSESLTYSFHTIKPGIIAGQSVPFINVRVFARGMLIHALTRLYFADEDNSKDEVLRSIPTERQGTLIAKQVEGASMPTYQFDIKFQEDDETVFFNP